MADRIETGTTFGRWTVVRRAAPARRSSAESYDRARVVVKCVCGRERYAFEVDLRSARTRGCSSSKCAAKWDAVQGIREVMAGAIAAYLTAQHDDDDDGFGPDGGTPR